jgi:hypothetical protein
MLDLLSNRFLRYAAGVGLMLLWSDGLSKQEKASSLVSPIKFK